MKDEVGQTFLGTSNMKYGKNSDILMYFTLVSPMSPVYFLTASEEAVADNKLGCFLDAQSISEFALNYAKI